jgi:hypothetical protein
VEPGVDVMIAIIGGFHQFSAVFANFRQFSPVFGEKLAFCSKNKCYNQLFVKTCSCWRKNANFVAKCFGKKIKARIQRL